jgi:hypothetical protein
MALSYTDTLKMEKNETLAIDVTKKVGENWSDLGSKFFWWSDLGSKIFLVIWSGVKIFLVIWSDLIQCQKFFGDLIWYQKISDLIWSGSEFFCNLLCAGKFLKTLKPGIEHFSGDSPKVVAGELRSGKSEICQSPEIGLRSPDRRLKKFSNFRSPERRLKNLAQLMLSSCFLSSSSSSELELEKIHEIHFLEIHELKPSSIFFKSMS